MAIPFDKTRRLEDLERQAAMLDLAVRQGQRDPTGIGKRWVYLAITARESVSYPDGDSNTYPIIFIDRESTNVEGEHDADDTERSVDPVAYGRTVNGQPLLEGEVCYAYPLPKPVTDGKCRWVLEPLTKIYWGNLNEELTPGGSAEVSVYTPAGVGPDDWEDSGEDRTVYEVLLADDAEPLPVDTKIAFVWYFDRFVMLGGAGGAGLTRFRLTGSLSTGGQANAKILTYNGVDYDESDETITVIDWWAVTNQAPGLTRGMWQGVAGMEGWCRRRERPADEETPPEQDEYEIVWMEQYARVIEFTLAEGFTSRQSPGASVTASHQQGCDPGSTVTVRDMQDRWTDAIAGCKGTAVLDEYSTPTNPGAPYYRVISCQRAAKRARATLTAALCSSVVSFSDWSVYQQGEFVADAGPGQVFNPAGHRGMLGDTIWLERMNNTTPFQWHVVRVEKHDVQLLTCATSIVDGVLDKCCITAAVEVCELPPCAAEETSSTTSSFPDIPDNSSVYECCQEYPAEVTFSVRANGEELFSETSADLGIDRNSTDADSVYCYWLDCEVPGFGCINSSGLETIRLLCQTEEGGVLPGYMNSAGDEYPPGLYMVYEFTPTGAGPGSNLCIVIVPVTVMSCSPLHITASLNMQSTDTYYSNGSGGYINDNIITGCQVDIDIEITE